MTVKNSRQKGESIRLIAHDSATDCVPLSVTGEPDFEAWSAVVSDVAVSIEASLHEAAE
jgi:hypothetical protein